jgi:hypothetical protein
MADAPVPESSPKAVKAGEVPESLLEPKTQADRDERDRWIFRARASKMEWSSISQVFQLDEKNCRTAARRYRERQRSDVLDRETAQDVVHETLDGWDHRLQVLATMIAAPTGGKNGVQASVKIAAIRESNAIERDKLTMLQEMRLLPRDLGTFSVELDLMEVARRIVDILQEHEVGDAVQHAILAAVRGELPPGEDPVEAEVVSG